MTGKLMKYEFRSSLRNIGIIWAALIAAAVLFGIMLRTTMNISAGNHAGILRMMEIVFTIVPPLLYIAMFVAMLVITVLIVIMRFYRGLLGDEGYLMHTLPVKPWQLITSKGLVASCIVLVSSIVAVLSIFILVAIQDAGGFFDGMGDVFKAMGREPRWIIVTIECIIILVLSIMKSVYQIYAAMAIGQLSGKHRLLTSLGAYVAISMVLTILLLLLMTAADAIGIMTWINDNLMQITDGFKISQLAIGGMFALTAVQVAAFHVITERILSKKLNLI